MKILVALNHGMFIIPTNPGSPSEELGIRGWLVWDYDRIPIGMNASSSPKEPMVPSWAPSPAFLMGWIAPISNFFWDMDSFPGGFYPSKEDVPKMSEYPSHRAWKTGSRPYQRVPCTPRPKKKCHLAPLLFFVWSEFLEASKKSWP